jgi:hypothetical protein
MDSDKPRLIRRLLQASVWGILPVFFLSAFVAAGAVRPAPAEDTPGEVCTVELQMEFPDLCPDAGPGAVRADYWQMGLIPRRPLPVMPLDTTLGILSRSYARAGKDAEVGFYSSVQAAISGHPNHSLLKGFVYVSYVETIKNEEGTFYRTGDGWIVRGDEVTPIAYKNQTIKNQFNGVTLAAVPDHPFGWILPAEGLYPSRTPGGKPDTKAAFYPRYTPVEAFDSAKVDQATWYMIGINQWVVETKVGLIFPDAKRPDGIPAGAKWISVNLFEQSLAAYEGDRMVFATLVASGLPGFWTRPGLFQTYKKYELQNMSGAFEQDKSDYYYVGDVPWVMYFDRARAIHGEYWHNSLGGRHSHGCVNIPVADGHWLFNWAPTGTWVYVFDPSGKTPTDEKYYLNDAGV